MPLQLVKDLPPQERALKTCMFCHRKDDNELQFGKFYTNDNITAHYYCLLFSSGLEQKGTDEEGILGFLKHDIIKESKRGSKLSCSKCRHNGATVGCCNKACKKTYHFPCGVESRMLNQYFGAFNSYCIKHQPIQNVVVKGHGQKATCTICHEDVIAHPNFDVLWAPCCKKQSWFHRVCMQKLALSAGYFFKCPICSNNTLFCSEMKRCGIYVPEQDASWELEPNAFQELVQRHNKCDHAVCICPKGRQHDGEGTRWELLLCASCGSKGIHIGCGRLDWSTMEWDCDDCSSLESRRNSANASPAAVVSIVPPASAMLTPLIANTFTHRSGVKRPRSGDSTSGSEAEAISSEDESEVDITSVSDAESPANSLASPTYSGATCSQPSRNVARRGGRGGSWSSRANTSRSEPKRSCNFDKLRFKVTDDDKNIIVIFDNDDQTQNKSYTIPVDQPNSHYRKIRATSKCRCFVYCSWNNDLRKTYDMSIRPSADMDSFRNLLQRANAIVILTGAGVSAESGVPTFRGAGGLWRTYSAIDLATPSAFRSNPSLVWEFYHHRRENMSSKLPNNAHKAIAEFERRLTKDGKHVSVITQNIDELHQRAGSINILELHGSLFKTQCLKCKRVEPNYDSPICEAMQGKWSASQTEGGKQIPELLLPRCKVSSCGGLLRPYVVWFGESLDPAVLEKAEKDVDSCDLCLVIGTSSVVYPAAMFAPQIAARGVPVAEFNMETTSATHHFSFHFSGPCGELLPIALAP